MWTLQRILTNMPKNSPRMDVCYCQWLSTVSHICTNSPLLERSLTKIFHIIPHLFIPSNPILDVIVSLLTAPSFVYPLRLATVCTCTDNDSDWPLYPPARLSLQARLTSTRDSDEWPRNPDASDPARSTSRYYDLLDEKAILQADLSRIQKDKQELTTALSAAQAAQRQHDATCAAQLAQLKSAQSTIATLKGQPAGASMQASTHRAMCAKAREEANSWRERCLGRDEGASDDVPMDASADDPPVEARTGMEELKAELDRERERRIAAETLSQTLQDECQALVASMAELKTGHSLISVFVDAARELNARRAGVES